MGVGAVYSVQGILLSGGEVRSRDIHDGLSPESLCVLVEKGKEDTRLAGRRGDEVCYSSECIRVTCWTELRPGVASEGILVRWIVGQEQMVVVRLCIDPCAMTVGLGLSRES